MLSTLISILRPRACRDHLLIACMPKSGSTYLHTVLREITGFRDAYVSEWGEQNEGDICERRLRRLRRRSVLQQHLKATTTNVKWMAKYNLRPIVQFRSLFDVVPSIHDHLEKGQGGLPSGCIRPDFWTKSWSDRMVFLIQAHLPWYFNFLLSWREAVNEIEFCPISYEELFADQVGSLSRILDFYRIQASQEEIAAGIERASHCDTRFNVGISGRGSQRLTSLHKQAIRNMAHVCGFELSDMGSVIAPFGSLHAGSERPDTIAMFRAAA